MSRQRYSTRNQNTTTFRGEQRSIGPISNTIMLIVLACLLGLLYLTQVTKANSYTYKIDDLRNEQSSLEAEHNQLVLDAARLQSLERIKTSEAAKQLVSAAPTATLQN